MHITGTRPIHDEPKTGKGNETQSPAPDLPEPNRLESKFESQGANSLINAPPYYTPQGMPPAGTPTLAEPLAKSLEDRKAFLKEKGICFKCCSSTSHFAKDCKFSLKCFECDSTNHDAAMHPGPATQSVRAPPPPPDNGGEGEDNMTDITTSCTEVCGLGQGGCSCSKICHLSQTRVF